MTKLNDDHKKSIPNAHLENIKQRAREQMHAENRPTREGFNALREHDTPAAPSPIKFTDKPAGLDSMAGHRVVPKPVPPAAPKIDEGECPACGGEYGHHDVPDCDGKPFKAAPKKE